ncbi:MAG: abortive infection family protein [Thermomicrobiales bacterium]
MAISTPDSLFTMHGAREVIELSGGALPIYEQVNAIESGMQTSPSLVFDLSRALVESTCKTILEERGRSPIPSRFNDLLKETYTATSLVPGSMSDDEVTCKKMEELLAGFEGVIGAISHLRHTFGVCSHGKTPSASSLEAAHALLAARSADAVVHFLYSAHKFFFAPVPEKPIDLAENGDFNEYVDSLYEPVELLGGSYQASEVLYRVDEFAYRDALAGFKAEVAVTEVDDLDD